MVYNPGIVYEIPKIFEPQFPGWLGLVLVPNVPLTILNVLGVISQYLPVVVEHVPLLLTVAPAIEVLVNVTVVLIHTIVSGEIVNWLIGWILVVIGWMVKSEKPHGFCALMLIKKVFGVIPPVAPQDVLVKIWI